MSSSSLKRLLWVMNEILAASPHGITRDEICTKWIKSVKNDRKETDISERTFHRIKNELTELFECEIVCNATTKKYSVRLPDYYDSDNQLTLLDILLMKEKKSRKDTTINEILQLLTKGNDIPNDDMQAARDLSYALSRLPHRYAHKLFLIAKDGKIKGADMTEKDEYYSDYVCVWKDSVYKLTRQWLSIGFYDSEVCFYVVTDEKDSAERQRKAFEACLDDGVRYRGGYYWHKPSNKELFTLKFDTKPNMEKIVQQTELLLSQLQKVTPTKEVWLN